MPKDAIALHVKENDGFQLLDIQNIYIEHLPVVSPAEVL